MKNFSVKWQAMDKKKKLTVFWGAGIFLCAVVVVLLVRALVGGEEEVSYRETQVLFGSLSVGVTESGAVDIGTVEQTFDLDMSALQRVTTSDDSSGSSRSGDMGGNGSTQNGSASSLVIAEVCVSVGQQVAEGDALYELEEDSVSELAEQLEANVEKAEADLAAVYADQVLSKQTAQYTYDYSTAYGSYAQTEYDATVAELQQAVAAAEKQLEQANASLEDYSQQLEEATQLYEEAVQRLADCQWSLDHADKWEDTYGYVSSFQLVQSAQSTADSLEQKKERLESSVEQAADNVETAERNLSKARRNLSQGLLTAAETYALRQLAYDTAQETYDIALAYLEEDAKAQEQTYAETLEKWEEYSSHVDGTAIRSQYNGVITGIELEAGDSIHTGTVLVTLYNMDEVTMTVTVDEEDMTDIALGGEAIIRFTAYPDEIFRATVTEIADAELDSYGNVTYDVTATVQGDVSGLYQGMTGDITFVTEETAEVLYVSRRAILTEGDDTYVKVRDENGKIQKIQVTTGFTDGTYIEITGGLSENDVVLIESKVTN